jgi:F-type H+-transporting ATPase subunit b
MFEVNGTLVIFVASFLLFMLILDAILLKPVAKVIALRDEKIKADVEAGKSSRERAQNLLERYEQDLRDMRDKAQKHIADASEQANKERLATLAQLHKNGQLKLNAAKAEIENERAGLIDALIPEEKALVETITQKVLGEPVPVQLDYSQVRKTLEGPQ